MGVNPNGTSFRCTACVRTRGLVCLVRSGKFSLVAAFREFFPFPPVQ